MLCFIILHFNYGNSKSYKAYFSVNILGLYSASVYPLQPSTLFERTFFPLFSSPTLWQNGIEFSIQSNESVAPDDPMLNQKGKQFFSCIHFMRYLSYIIRLIDLTKDCYLSHNNLYPLPDNYINYWHAIYRKAVCFANFFVLFLHTFNGGFEC